MTFKRGTVFGLTDVDRGARFLMNSEATMTGSVRYFKSEKLVKLLSQIVRGKPAQSYFFSDLDLLLGGVPDWAREHPFRKENI